MLDNYTLVMLRLVISEDKGSEVLGHDMSCSIASHVSQSG